jgi:ubiquinone/menaquinone biosynthesis C-methylase UbiE
MALLTAIAGCYGLLAEVLPDAGAAALASPFNRLGEFRDMCRFQLEEPRALRAIEPGIGALGRISDTISRAVRQQYEENPYPRWRFLGEPRTETLDNRIRRCLPHLAPDQQPALQALPDQAVEVLIAGCGTGRQALWCGREYPAARILAIDLSRASLAYGLLKAREFAIANVEFLHGDLLDLPELGRQFDFIESIGVLHHMADPARGLAALARCLRAGGWMKVALYSESARAAVRAARRRIAEEDHPSTADGIRNFRHLLMSDTDDPLHEACIRWRDFFTLSECRDLLFHVQEHQFTTERIAAMITPLGLQFMGLEADPEFLANNEPRVSDPTSLAQWGEFEKAHPDFFGSMYVMWLRRPG